MKAFFCVGKGRCGVLVACREHEKCCEVTLSVSWMIISSTCSVDVVLNSYYMFTCI